MLARGAPFEIAFALYIGMAARRASAKRRNQAPDLSGLPRQAGARSFAVRELAEERAPLVFAGACTAGVDAAGANAALATAPAIARQAAALSAHLSATALAALAITAPFASL